MPAKERAETGYKGYNVKTERQKGHCNFVAFAAHYSRIREYAERGPAVSRFLITVLR